MKNVKMYFSRDVFYDDPTRPLYLGGHTYEIAENNVEKWLKRGAHIVDDLPKDSPIKHQAPSTPGVAEEIPEALVPIEPPPEEAPAEDTKEDKKKKSSKGK